MRIIFHITILLSFSDNEEELDIPTVQITEADPAEPSSANIALPSSPQQQQKSSPAQKMGGSKQHVTSAMSRISGVRHLKNMLNSGTPPSGSSPLLRKRYNEQMEKQQKAQQKLLQYGVDTPTPNELGQHIEQINRWGVDIFKLGTLAANHPLTAVTYTVLKVSFILSSVRFSN